MSAHIGHRLQCAALCLSIAAYAGLSHYCNTHGSADLGAALALGPVVGLAVLFAWRSLPPAAAALLGAGLAILMVVFWSFLRRRFDLFSLVEETGVYVLLGMTFGRTLRRGRVALCTQLADKEHGPLSPFEVLYTRRVTAAWTAFFFAVAAASMALFVGAPRRIWSLYINFCVLPLVGAMFVAEYWVRRRVLPQVRRAGLLATVRVYLAAPQ